MKELELIISGLITNQHRLDEFNRLLCDESFTYNICWNTVNKFAYLHEVIPQLIYTIKKLNCENKIPKNIWKQWNDIYIQTAALNLCRKTALNEITTLFSLHKIPTIILRGASLAWYLYPSPELRPMADLDLLVPDSSINLTVKLLLNNGYLQLQSGEWNFRHPKFENVFLDLHTDIFPWRGKKINKLWEKAKPQFFSNYENNLYEPAQFTERIFYLPPEEAIIAQACHASLCHGFPKLLWLTDLSLLTRQHNINWAKVWEICSSLKVKIPVLTFLTRANKLANANIVIPHYIGFRERVAEKFLLKITGAIDMPPLFNIGHLLCFIWTTNFSEKLENLKGYFIPSKSFLARRYGKAITIFWKIFRPFMILWEAILLLGRLIFRSFLPAKYQ